MRVLLKDSQLIRKTATFGLVSAGGMLVSIAPSVSRVDVYLMVISVGALASFCGLIVWFRLSPMPLVERRQAAERLAEDLTPTALSIPADAEKYDVPIRPERDSAIPDRLPSESYDSTEAMLAATDVAALAGAIGTKERFHPPPGTDHPNPSTGFYCFGSLVAAEASNPTPELQEICE